MFTTLEYLGLIPSILHLSLTSAVEDPVPLCGLCGHWTHVIYILIWRQDTHT